MCQSDRRPLTPLDDDPLEEGLEGEEPLLTLTVSPDEAGERLDKWLAARLTDRSRSEAQRWIQEGRVTLRERELKPSYRLAAGDVIQASVPSPEGYEVEPEPIPLAVLYEDEDLLVVDKPAGMVVHPAAGNWHGTLVNAVLHHCPMLEGVGGVRRPGIVHRLDKDTSGVILVAKNDRTHRALQAQFLAREVHKRYLALVYGRLVPDHGEIVATIGRDPRNRKRMGIVPPPRGREAATRYETLATYRSKVGRESLSLVACYPFTGRTHQIRVHLAHVKHPIVGDQVYASRRKPPVICPRQFLHAEAIRFRLPGTGRDVEFVAPLPPDLLATLKQLETGS